MMEGEKWQRLRVPNGADWLDGSKGEVKQPPREKEVWVVERQETPLNTEAAVRAIDFLPDFANKEMCR